MKGNSLSIKPNRIILMNKQKLIDQKARNKRKVLAHQQFDCYKERSSFAIDRNSQKRASSSETQYRYRSSSFSKDQSCQKQRQLTYSFVSKGQSVRRKLKQQNYRKILYSRSEGREQDLSQTNPWGGPAIAKGIQTKNSSKEKLLQQRKSIQKLNKLKNEVNQNEYLASSLIKYKVKPSQQLVKVELIRKRVLSDYLEFIHGEGMYTLGFDFSYLRGLSRTEAEKVVDFSHFKVMESIFLCMLDVFGSQTGFTQKGCYKLLRQYSLLYFRIFEKILAQFVVYYHIFKLSHGKILSFFVQARICLMILYETAAEEEALNESFNKIFEDIVKNISAIYRILYEGEQEIMKEQNYVGQTFKMLKSSNIIDKKVGQLTGLTQRIIQLTHQKPRVNQILKQMSPLLREMDLGGLQLQYLAQTQCAIGWNYFKIPPVPYLGPKPVQKPYTLVLSLTSTLVSYNSETRVVQYRPFLQTFLERAGQFFELIVWSEQLKQIGDAIVTSVEQKSKVFNFRLYGQHFSLRQGILGRDMTRLGRETQKTLLVVSKKEGKVEGGRKKRKEKGVIEIKQFGGSRTDSQLLKVLQRLQWLTEGLPSDIINRQPLHLNTLEHIQEELEEGLTISTHN